MNDDNFDYISKPDPPGGTNLEFIRHALGNCLPDDNCPFCRKETK